MHVAVLKRSSAGQPGGLDAWKTLAVVSSVPFAISMCNLYTARRQDERIRTMPRSVYLVYPLHPTHDRPRESRMRGAPMLATSCP
jgi:hypothetical protein